TCNGYLYGFKIEVTTVSLSRTHWQGGPAKAPPRPQPRLSASSMRQMTKLDTRVHVPARQRLGAHRRQEGVRCLRHRLAGGHLLRRQHRLHLHRLRPLLLHQRQQRQLQPRREAGRRRHGPPRRHQRHLHARGGAVPLAGCRQRRPVLAAIPAPSLRHQHLAHGEPRPAERRGRQGGRHCRHGRAHHRDHALLACL
uniref:Uncharacterized protein n=1 Tax=Aegilops tauschii subsp. strangulata TaxID=200361 RepID=A0A453FQ16_AEGTS